MAAVPAVNDDHRLAGRLTRRLNIYFAVATCLGGMTLGGNPQTEMLPVIACVFAIIGLVFVDLLRWFSLPPIAAYVALGCIAFYSISRLMEGGGGVDEIQMVVVAELLVLVQAVLMVQKKNRRIYEQLAIFCLLELVVAAIFNDALTYGLILLPLGLVGIGGLVLLQTYGTVLDAFGSDGDPAQRGETTRPASGAVAGRDGRPLIHVRAPGAIRSFRLAGLKLPRVTMLTFAPAVVMIAMLFFYGLPRTGLSASGGGGRVLVGFAETVKLGQIGRMLQNDSPALRIELINRKTGKPYSVVDNLYLRGAVLETYHSGAMAEGDWSSVTPRTVAPSSLLPMEPMSRVGWDGEDIRVRISVEPSNTDALFSIPPYSRLATTPEVRHTSDRWLLGRRPTVGILKANRITYQFATSAFRDARQSRYMPRWDDTVFPDDTLVDMPRDEFGDVDPTLDESVDDTFLLLPGRAQSVRRISRFEADQYVRRCLEYDEYRIPSAWRLSDLIAQSAGPDRYQLANAIEQFLVSRGGYSYSLNQTGRDIPGLDPIEQFLSVHKQGNCQYFASAMTMMLRSQGIPARLVVGYSTDEYNSIGGFYIARQLHAHAWVEALIDQKWVPEDDRYRYAADDAPSTAAVPGVHGYWVRFDPTPGGGGVERRDNNRVTDVFQLAQNYWTDFVVERNSANSAGRDFSATGNDAVASQYQSMFRWIDMKVAQIRAGQLGGGALAIGKGFSWPAAILGVVLTLVVVAMFQIRMPRSWWWRRKHRLAGGEAAIPEVPFFAETVRLLSRAGIQRQASQTPLELTDDAAIRLAGDHFPPIDSPLRTLTDAFYDTRFGSKAASPAEAVSGEAVAAALRVVRERVESVESRIQKSPNKP